MTEEMKLNLFKMMLSLEEMADGQTYDGHNYYEQANGAYAMLKVLGLGSEYIRWCFNQTKNRKGH